MRWWREQRSNVVSHESRVESQSVRQKDECEARMTKSKQGSLIPAERIEHAILLLRGQKVMIDADLAALYAVETGQLVRAVKRNIERFPQDFAFQLTQQGFTNLMADLRRMHLTEDFVSTSQTIWGMRYEIVAPITGPSGDAVLFRSVWQIDLGTDVPRLITMYPE